MAVRGIDDDHVAAGLDERLHARSRSADADGRGEEQAAALVLGRVGVRPGLLDVLDGDEALDLPAVVDDQQLLDAVLVQQLLGLSS